MLYIALLNRKHYLSQSGNILNRQRNTPLLIKKYNHTDIQYAKLSIYNNKTYRKY